MVKDIAVPPSCLCLKGHPSEVLDINTGVEFCPLLVLHVRFLLMEVLVIEIDDGL